MRFFLVSALALALSCAASSSPPAQSPAPSTSDAIWIRDVTVVSLERPSPLPHAHVVLREGRIVSVDTTPPTASGMTIVEGAGHYLVPGLIDGHVHLAEVPGMTHDRWTAAPALAKAYFDQLPRSYLYFGFTTVVDLNVVDRATFERIKSAPVGPRILDCGGGVMTANGYPMAYLPPEMRYSIFSNFLYDSAQSIPAQFPALEHTPAAVVDRVARSGAVCVKAFYEPGFADQEGKLPLPSLETMRGVASEAHEHKLPLLMHANRVSAHRFALDAGADIAVHGIWEWEQPRGTPHDVLPANVRTLIDDEIHAGMGVMPTSRVISGLEDLFLPEFLDDPQLTKVLPMELLNWYRSDDGKWFAQNIARGFEGMPRERIKAIYRRLGDDGRMAAAYFASHGGKLLFGSDTPSGPLYTNPPGYNGFLEMRELERAGISPRAILESATLANARALALHDEGTVQAGKRANLLLLDADPLASTAAFDRISSVIVNGRVISRGDLAVQAKTAAH